MEGIYPASREDANSDGETLQRALGPLSDHLPVFPFH